MSQAGGSLDINSPTAGAAGDVLGGGSSLGPTPAMTLGGLLGGDPNALGASGSPLGPTAAAPPGSVTTDPSGGGLMANLAKLKDTMSLFGSTPEEREKNAKAFAAMVKDVGSLGQNLQSSTLLQRLFRHGLKAPIADIGGGQPTAGVSPIPRSFDPSIALMQRNYSFK